MYDKYFIVNPINLGSSIPKHKGLLVNCTNFAGSNITLHVKNSSGNTFSIVRAIPAGFSILDNQAYAVPTGLLSGVTVFYVN
jgi:hypothetical protein